MFAYTIIKHTIFAWWVIYSIEMQNGVSLDVICPSVYFYFWKLYFKLFEQYIIYKNDIDNTQNTQCINIYK